MGQLAFPSETWPCDLCNRGVIDNPETGGTRRCPACDGTGSLDYDPATVADNPFAGIEEIR